MTDFLRAVTFHAHHAKQSAAVLCLGDNYSSTALLSILHIVQVCVYVSNDRVPHIAQILYITNRDAPDPNF